MWHASVATTGMIPFVSAMGTLARRALDGVGDPSLGEWSEWTGRAYHLRRRLSAAEAEQVGEVVDIRGTHEADLRLMPVAHLLPPGWNA